MNATLENKLKQINIEDRIWLIYIGIIFLSWYANNLERKYFIFKEEESKRKYRNVMIFIFAILVIVYFYFFKQSLSDVKNIKSIDSNKNKTLIYLSFYGSLLILIGGLIFLYIAIVDEDLSVELAFD